MRRKIGLPLGAPEENVFSIFHRFNVGDRQKTQKKNTLSDNGFTECEWG